MGGIGLKMKDLDHDGAWVPTVSCSTLCMVCKVMIMR